MDRKSRILPALSMALALSCCCRSRPLLPTFPEQMAAPEVLEQLRSRQAQVATLIAEGKGSLRGAPGGDGTFLWRCWAQGTSRMRLTLSHRLKGLLADAVIDGDRAECYDAEAGILERGALSEIRVPGLRQTASLLRLLAGPADTLAFDPESGNRLTLDIGGDRRWRLKLNRNHLVYESAELRQGPQEILARVAFELEAYRMKGGVPWPMAMVVDQPGEPWKLKLGFSEVSLGAPIDPEVFRLRTPEGTKAAAGEPAAP